MVGHYLEKNIYYHDTDAGGVVYYGAYLKHFEEARTEYFRSLGIDLAEYAKNGTLFSIAHLEVDYIKPARYGDIIRVFTRPEKVGNASLRFIHEIKRGDVMLVSAKIVWACVNKDMKPTRIPEAIRIKILT